VAAALRASGAELVIDELTSLPKTPSELPAHAARDRKLRIEGGGNLHRAALTCGLRRYIQQSSGFFLEAKGALADESSPLALVCEESRAQTANIASASLTATSSSPWSKSRKKVLLQS
jgi:hypothetical protein